MSCSIRFLHAEPAEAHDKERTRHSHLQPPRTSARWPGTPEPSYGPVHDGVVHELAPRQFDASDSAAYRFLSSRLREQASRFMPGTIVLSQPTVPEPIPLRFPFLPLATNPDEAEVDEVRGRERAETIMGDFKAMSGAEAGL